MKDEPMLDFQSAQIPSNAYGLMSLGLSFPNESFLRVLSSKSWLVKLDDTLGDNESLRVIHDSCVELQGVSESLLHKGAISALEELNGDYTKLFLVPGPAQIHPYESMHQGNGSTLISQFTVEVLKTYRDDDLTLSEKEKEFPDHFTVECEYLAHLARRELGVLVNGRSDIATSLRMRASVFVCEHLGQWGLLFSRQVTAQAMTAFYKEMGRLAECLISWDLGECAYIKKQTSLKRNTSC